MTSAAYIGGRAVNSALQRHNLLKLRRSSLMLTTTQALLSNIVMNPSPICLGCRRKIFGQLRKAARKQWPATSSRATFISLSTPQTTPMEVAPEDARRAQDTKTNRRGKHSSGINHRISKPFVADQKGDLLELLFEESLKPQTPSSQPPQPRPTIASLENFRALESLRDMLDNPNSSIVEVWRFFVTNLGPKVWRSGVEARPSLFSPTANALLRQLIRQRSSSPDVPRLSEIARIYAALGILDLKTWRLLVGELLRELSPQAPIHDVAEDQNALARERLIQDLLGLWRVFCISGGLTTAPDSLLEPGNISDWAFMPQKDVSTFPDVLSRSGLVQSFKVLLKGRDPPSQLKQIAASAFSSFAILAQDQDADGRSKFADNPFMTNLTRIIVNSRAARGDFVILLRSDPCSAPFGDGIDWSLILATVRDSGIEVASPHINRRVLGADSVLDSMQRRLIQALANKDLTKVDNLWKIASKSSRNQNHTLRDKPTAVLSQDLYDRFIMVYMGLRQPNQAIEVWNTMISNSLTPTLKTWNAMLEGCKASRDPAALEGVWTKMVSSGVQPDMACWTTRISGLVEGGKPDKAIKALEQMGRLWVQAAKTSDVGKLHLLGDIDGFIKPTIETINAAIVGLLRRKHSDAAQRVLAWGGRLGIQPDLITFNTLLRSMTREGRTEDIQKLIGHMASMGLNADVATFTTVLDDAFRNAEHMTPEEQIEVVQGIFQEMEVSGIQANHFTYGTIIYGLLRSPSNDMTAVQMVLSRMTSKGLTPSPQIYTSIISRHFRQDRPDLEAIRSILERIQLSGVVMDHVFWDRVIEGYSRVRDTTSALRIMGKVDREGSRVGFWALNMVITALVENEELDLARQVVRNVRADRGEPPPMEKKGADGEHAFWEFAASHDLIEE